MFLAFNPQPLAFPLVTARHDRVTAFVTGFSKKNLGKMRFVTTSRVYAGMSHPLPPFTALKRSVDGSPRRLVAP